MVKCVWEWMPVFPPFAVATADDLFGLDIDVGKAIGEHLGISGALCQYGI